MARTRAVDAPRSNSRGADHKARGEGQVELHCDQQEPGGSGQLAGGMQGRTEQIGELFTIYELA